jgi:hypothetical protein
MPGDFNDQACVLDQDWAAAGALGALRSNGLDVVVVIRAKKLAQIGMEGAFPGDGEDLAHGRRIFLYRNTGRCLDFMQRIGIAAAGVQSALHFGDVFLDGGCIATQRGGKRKGKREDCQDAAGFCQPHGVCSFM